MAEWPHQHLLYRGTHGLVAQFYTHGLSAFAVCCLLSSRISRTRDSATHNGQHHCARSMPSTLATADRGSCAQLSVGWMLTARIPFHLLSFFFFSSITLSCCCNMRHGLGGWVCERCRRCKQCDADRWISGSNTSRCWVTSRFTS